MGFFEKFKKKDKDKDKKDDKCADKKDDEKKDCGCDKKQRSPLTASPETAVCFFLFISGPTEWSI